MNRRGFLTGMAGILAAGYSASVLPSGVIMPIKKLWTPPQGMFMVDGSYYMMVHPSNYAILREELEKEKRGYEWDVRSFG
jgi:hypothetical protein